MTTRFSFDTGGGAEDADLLLTHGVDRVHDQVEVHAAEARQVSGQHGGIQLTELEIDARGALLHDVAVDDVAGELFDLGRDVELLAHLPGCLLVEEMLDPALHPTDPVDAVPVEQARADRARVLGQEVHDLVDPAPEWIQDQRAEGVDGVDVLPAGQQNGPVRREVPHGVGVVLEGLPQVDGLLLQHLQVFAVQDLRLVDAVDLQIRVERHVKVNHFVDEALHAQVVNQELDLGDFFLDAFLVISHDLNRFGLSSRVPVSKGCVCVAPG